MAQFALQVSWLDPPDADEAFGPERSTWGALRIELDGHAVTRHAAVGAATEEAAVIGGMSGLAEWIVDHWMCVLWETHTPFPKTSRRRLPALGDVRRGELGRGIEPSRVAAWQGRHVLGAGNSDLALPSISLLADERDIGVLVAEPPMDRGSSVYFRPSDGFGGEPVWLSKDDVTDELSRFVAGTIARAKADDGSAVWANWLSMRFDAAVARARSEPERRRMMFGELAAAQWDAVATSLGRDAAALAGVLVDCDIVDDESDLTSLTSTIRDAARHTELDDRWRKVHVGAESLGRKPYERGYELATAARKLLGEPLNPLTDIREVLQSFGVQLQGFAGKALFRSAAVCAEGGPPVVLQASRHPRNNGVAPSRFAIAAALGRVLAQPGQAGKRSAFGAAHGEQSRWQATQQANAFAAELLLPASALHGADLQDLCDRYGISRSAAGWHRGNR